MKKAITPDWQRQIYGLFLVGALLGSNSTLAGPASNFNSNPRPLLTKAVTSPRFVTWTITGRVSSAAGEALPGVTVLLKGTSTGVTSDPSGNYSLTVPETAGTLVFSFIGFATQEKSFSGPGAVNVTLADDTKALQEVVVTGYTAQSKKDITGAVATIDAKQLLATPSTNLGQAMQGKVAGVTVGNENSPGGGVMVRIRGFGTINDNSPLYVIDGVPTKGNLNTLNLNDIESMQILKDASAASIYGSRAGNGVVIVTTKKGKAGKPVFTYETYVGTQRPGKFLDLLNTQEYARLVWESRRNAGAVGANGNPVHAQFGNGVEPVIPDYIFPAGAMEGDPRVAQDASGKYVNYSNNIDDPNFNRTKWLITKANKTGTDWMDEIFDPAPIQNHQLGVSGGNESGRYAMSVNYFNQEGIMIHTGFKRYSLRANTEFNVNKRIRVGENFQVAVSNRVLQPGSNGFENNPTAFAYRIQPLIPVYDVAGNFAGTRGTDLDNSNNPVSMLYRMKDNNQKEIRLFGNAYAEVDILKNLTAKTSFGVDYNIFNYRNYTFRDYESAEARGSNNLQTTNNYEWTWTWFNTLAYNATLGDNHRLNFLIGTEAIKDYHEFFDATRTNFAIDELDNRYLSGGTGVQTNNGGGWNWSLASEFAKANYAFADKYLLEGTIRRDRSSRFAANFRTAYFPAASAGWVFSEENFAEGWNNWLSRAKLRVGWGQTGNQEIGNYNSITQYSTNPITSFYDLGGTRTSAIPGYELTQFGNANAKWETTTATNVGIDLSLLNDKIDASFDWYTRTTSDMLFPVQAPLTSGVAITPFQNIGSMRNRGVDAALTYNGQAADGKLTYSIGGNFSTYRNEVIKTTGDPNTQYFGLNDERIQNLVVTQQGHPISSFFGYTIDGIFQSDDEAAAAPKNNLGVNQNRAGRFHYRDIAGAPNGGPDGIVDSKDLSIIGSPHPDFTYGINLNVNYKNFGLSLFGQGVQGNEIFNMVKYFTDFPTFGGNRSKRMLYDSWRPGKTDAILPQLTSSDQVSILPSTYYLEDGSYFRMKNIQLTYTLPALLVSKIGLGSVKVYVQGQNVFTFTEYSGMDPEVNLRTYTSGNDRQIGVDGGNYPIAKQYLVGLNLSF